MKKIVFATIFAFCLMAVVAPAWAQDCSSWNNSHLSGTYTMSGNGYVDPSLFLPGMGLPSGAVPMFWVGAFTLDGSGGGSGWVSSNAGGSQMNTQLVGVKYSVQPDCSVQMSFSSKIKELGVTVGPVQRIMVIVPKPGQEMELHMIFVGSGPGKPPGAQFDLGVAHRISRQ
jgi:hypothetical protein